LNQYRNMARLLSLTCLSVAAVLAAAAPSTSRVPFAVSVRGGSDATPASFVASIPSGGASSGDYASQLESVKASVLQTASASIEELKDQIVTQQAIVEDFGSKAEVLCNKALEDFAQRAPESDDASNQKEYDACLEALEQALDTPLQVLYLQQLALLRQQALQQFRSATKTSGSSEYEAMLQADASFVRNAQASIRDGSDWEFSQERSYLQTVMNQMAESSKKAQDVQIKSAQQQQTAMQFLQQQQQMIQQLQMQLYGQSSPWNVGVAYRIPDTNFNLQASYQQGRANVQLSCVPDEYAPFLGPNGFTNGVGPGNLGLSLNLSV